MDFRSKSDQRFPPQTSGRAGVEGHPCLIVGGTHLWGSFPPSVNTSHRAQIAQQDPGGWKRKSSLLTLNTLHQVIVKSILTSCVTCGAADSQACAGEGREGAWERRPDIWSEELQRESICPMWNTQNLDLVIQMCTTFPPTGQKKTLALTISNRIFSPKIEWMTSIQLAGLLVPFRRLESLKSRRYFHKHFPRRWRNTLVLISQSNTATQPCFYLCEGGSIAPSN